MKRPVKYGLIAVFIHLFIILISDFIFPKISGEKYEAIMALFTFPELIYESPLLFVRHIFNISFQWLSIAYLIFNYLIGSMLYFLIGAFFAYVRSLPYKKETDVS